MAAFGIAGSGGGSVEDRQNVVILNGTQRGDVVLKMPKFRNKPSYIEWEKSVLDRLKQSGIRVAGILPALDGKPYAKVGDAYFVLYEKLNGKNDYGWGDVEGERLDAAGRLLARMHQALKDFEPHFLPARI